MRRHAVNVKLNDDELALLDERRSPGVTRAAALRALLREPPDPDPDVASRAEALAMLTALARDGKVAATIALARELRTEAEDPWKVFGVPRSES